MSGMCSQQPGLGATPQRVLVDLAIVHGAPSTFAGEPNIEPRPVTSGRACVLPKVEVRGGRQVLLVLGTTDPGHRICFTHVSSYWVRHTVACVCVAPVPGLGHPGQRMTFGASRSPHLLVHRFGRSIAIMAERRGLCPIRDASPRSHLWQATSGRQSGFATPLHANSRRREPSLAVSTQSPLHGKRAVGLVMTTVS